MNQPIEPTTFLQTTSWKRYESYKDSGVEWLGEIPEHWEVKQLKYVFKVINGSTPKSYEPSFWDGSIPWITPDDLGSLTNSIITKTARMITDLGYQSCGTTLVPAGSLILSTRAPIGHLAIAGTMLCTNQGCRSLVHQTNSNEIFFFYLLLSTKQELHSWGRGSTFLELGTSELESIKIPIPPLTHQQAIAVFLDHHTTRINTLITKKEQLIKLLKEKRTALISQAVTKGLDPTVPMKDSEVEWLGEIPEHWNLTKLKYCLHSIEQGWSPACDNRRAELNEWGVLKVGCVNGISFNSEENKALPSTTEPILDLEVKPGDILISRANTRELLGSAALISQVRPHLLLCDKLYRLKPRITEIDSEYLILLLRSSLARFQYERDATGASNSMQNISQSVILNLAVPLPVIAEQQTIINYVKSETVRIDALISRIQDGIQNLKEYSTALISAAVTGKIDVRDVGEEPIDGYLGEES